MNVMLQERLFDTSQHTIIWFKLFYRLQIAYTSQRQCLADGGTVLTLMLLHMVLNVSGALEILNSGIPSLSFVFILGKCDLYSICC